MLDLGIDLGPRSGADVSFGLDPQDSQRLLVYRRGGGCIRVLGGVFLGAGLALQAVGLLDGISWGVLLGGLVMGLLGAFLLFARSRTVFDQQLRPDRARFLPGHVDGISSRSRCRRSIGCDHREGRRQSRRGWRCQLFDDLQGRARRFRRDLVPVASTGLWETAVPVAEALSRFLRLPLHDGAVDRIRQPEELELSLREQRQRGSFKSIDEEIRRSKIGARWFVMTRVVL